MEIKVDFSDILLKIMLWCGTRLFDIVSVYSPKGKVIGISFSNDKKFIDHIGKYKEKHEKKV